MGPCAKATVRCTLVLADGSHVVGENWCRNPQPVCPRAPGEDYAKCTTVCAQQGHAEVVAVALAGPGRCLGARAYLNGHTYACQACQERLFGAGVESLHVGRPVPAKVVT
jgi:hypothetical protein